MAYKLIDCFWINYSLNEKIKILMLNVQKNMICPLAIKVERNDVAVLSAPSTFILVLLLNIISLVIIITGQGSGMG